jgi:glycyl-tRNA synthetase alpha chain
VRHLARLSAAAYVEQRQKLGYPLLKDEAQRAALNLEPLTKGGTKND